MATLLCSPIRLKNKLKYWSGNEELLLFFSLFFLNYSNGRLATFKKYTKKLIFQGNLEQAPKILNFVLKNQQHPYYQLNWLLFHKSSNEKCHQWSRWGNEKPFIWVLTLGSFRWHSNTLPSYLLNFNSLPTFERSVLLCYHLCCVLVTLNS